MRSLLASIGLILGTILSAPAVANWVPNAAPRTVYAFVVLDDDEDGDAAGKAIDELHDALKNFIGDVSEMRTMTNEQKVAYIKDKFKERAKAKALEQAYDFAKGKAEKFAQDAVKAAAWAQIEGRVRHEILVNGALSSSAWSKLKAEADSSFQAQFAQLKVLGKGIEIVGGVLWERSDKIAAGEYSWKQGALDVLGGVYDAVGESYIPFYGPFKKIVEVEMELLKALDKYCKDETINIWIGRVYEVNSAQADFKKRLAIRLRDFPSESAVIQHFDREFWDVTATGIKVPWDEKKIAEYRDECKKQVLEVYKAVQEDKKAAEKQAEELKQEATLARIRAESSHREFAAALKSGMEEGKKALELIDKFLTQTYPEALKKDLEAKKKKLESKQGELDRSTLMGEAFEGAQAVVSLVQQFGQQLLTAIKEAKPLDRKAAATAITAKRAEIAKKNDVEAAKRIHEKYVEEITKVQRAYDQKQITYEQKVQETRKLVEREGIAGQILQLHREIMDAQVTAEMRSAEQAVASQADPALDREIDRIRQVLAISIEICEKEVAKQRELAAQVGNVPYPPQRSVNSPWGLIDRYEELVEHRRALTTAIDKLSSIAKAEKAAIDKLQAEVDVQIIRFKKLVPDGRANVIGPLAYGEYAVYSLSSQPIGGSTHVMNAQNLEAWVNYYTPELTVTPIEARVPVALTEATLAALRDREKSVAQSIEQIEPNADNARAIVAFNSRAAPLFGPNANSKVKPNSFVQLYHPGEWDYSAWEFVPKPERMQEEIANLVRSTQYASQFTKDNAQMLTIGPFTIPLPQNIKVMATGIDANGKQVNLMTKEILKIVSDLATQPLKDRYEEVKPQIPQLLEMCKKIKRYSLFSRSDPMSMMVALHQTALLPDKIKAIEEAFEAQAKKNDEAIEAYTKLVSDYQKEYEKQRKEYEKQQEERRQKEVPLVEALYRQFKSAYESRNDAGVAACLDPAWEAPDGSRVSKMQETLRRSFRFFDEVKFEISNMKIAPSGNGRYRVSYSLVIRGRNFQRNIKHEEKSNVVEIAIVKNDKALILQTTEGQTWPGDGGG